MNSFALFRIGGKMKLAALGLAAAMIMGLAAPAMADELSDGFGQEDVINTESSYEGLDLGGACGNAPAAPEVNENTAPAAPANNESAQENTAETADKEKEPSFERRMKNGQSKSIFHGFSYPA